MYVRFSALIRLSFASLALACCVPSSDGATPLQASSNASRVSPFKDPVDINAATLQQLIQVPGLTRTWAARIIRFRPYRGKNDLLDRGIISAEVYARIKDHIIAHRLRN